jgi:CO/xanthine dehydrogenase FAD-binding subunit
VIPFEFDYYRVDSIEEALNLFQEIDSQGKEPLYYNGGTEIISMARKNDISANSVIDIKGIPECNEFKLESDKLTIGASVTLTSISEANLFPMLSKLSKGVADHTIQDKITFGGNICGKIIFRETVLAFLLCDSLAVIAGYGGITTVPINQVFKEKLLLGKGEFLVQLITDREYLLLPNIVIKKTKLEEIDYPLLTIAALKVGGWIRVALSGVCSYPFRSDKMEEILNNKGKPLDYRVSTALQYLPAPILDNIEASSGYRSFVLKNTLADVIRELEGRRK